MERENEHKDIPIHYPTFFTTKKAQKEEYDTTQKTELNISYNMLTVNKLVQYF